MNLKHIYYIIFNVLIVPVSCILSYFVFVVIRGTMEQTVGHVQHPGAVEIAASS